MPLQLCVITAEDAVAAYPLRSTELPRLLGRGQVTVVTSLVARRAGDSIRGRSGCNA
jgi:hypothetical protein